MAAKVSVIVPVYNVSSYLDECLASLTAQTLQDLEVIMVNDGSADKSGEIMETYADAHEHFRAFHKENGGLGQARNFGLHQARAPYIAFVDSDDVVSAKAYQNLYETAVQTGSDIVTGHVERFNSTKTYGSSLHQKVFRETIWNTHMTQNPELIYDTTSVNKLYKKAFWDQHQFTFPEGTFYEDIPVTLPAHYLASSVDILADVVYYWRSRDGMDTSITQQRNQLDNFQDRLRVLQMLDQFFFEHHIEGPLKEEKDYKALSVDLRLFLNQLNKVDEPYLDIFIREVSQYLKGIGPRVFQRLQAIDRLKYQLVRQGEKEKLLDVLRFQKEKLKTTKVMKKGPSYYGDYPYKEEFSTELLQLNDELQVVRKIEKAKWEGGVLFLKGYNYIEKVDVSHRRNVAMKAYLKNPLTHEQVAIPVEISKRPDVTHQRGVKASSKIPLKRLYHYHWSGFELSIDFQQADIARLGKARLQLWFQLKAGGLQREFRAGGPLSGNKSRPPALIEKNEKILVHYNQAKDLILEKTSLQAVVEGMKVAGSQLVIQGSSLEAVTAATLQLENQAGGLYRSYSLQSTAVPQQTSNSCHPFEARVDLRTLEEDDELEWQGSINTQNQRLALHVSPQGESMRQPGVSHEVWIGSDKTGQFKLAFKPLSSVLESLQWTDQGLKVSVRAYKQDLRLLAGEASIAVTLQHIESGKAFTIPCIEAAAKDPAYRGFTGEMVLTDEEGRARLDLGEWELGLQIQVSTDESSFVKNSPLRFEGGKPEPRVVSGLKLRPYRTGKGRLRVKVTHEWNWIERGPRRQEVTQKVLYPLFRMLPMNKKKVVFESYWGKSHSCNPRAIYEYMDQHHQDFRCVWSLKNENTPITGRGKAVRIHSWRYYYHLATAKYFINNANFPDFYEKRKRAVEVQTLHGTPLKTMGLDIPGEAASEKKRNKLLRRCDRWDYLLSPSRYVTDIARQSFAYKKDVLEVGFPRNDRLKANQEKESIAQIKRKLGLPVDKKVLLYAPTWRVKQSFKLELDLEQMQQALGDDWVILLRFHYFTDHAVDLALYQGFAYNGTTHDDINELYLISDVLITDYSSAMFDFANLGRPILFFTYDLERYRDQLRGFYINFEEEAPGPLIRTTEELIQSIQDIEHYDDQYGKQLKAFHDRYCEFDEGDACRKAVERIFKRPRQARLR